jgi:(S)-3,5-dihydroxyphenylglycine transaminase
VTTLEKNSLTIPMLLAQEEDVMGFLNEVKLDFPDADSLASGRPDERFFHVASSLNSIQSYLQFRHEETGRSVKDLENDLGQYNRAKGIINDLVAKFLANDEQIQCEPADILITVGAQEAMVLCGMALLNRDEDVVLLEDPCYVGMPHSLKLSGFHTEGFGLQSDGPDLAELEQKISRLAAEGKRCKLVYVIPDHQNPTGVCMSLEKRKRLLDLAQQYDFLIVEDNAYGIYSYDAERLPTLKSLDQNKRVVYLASMAKILYPGIRVSIVVADQEVNGMALSDLLASIKGYITVNTPSINQAIFGGILIENQYSLKQYCAPKVQAVKRKRDLLLNALDNEFSNKEWAKGITWNRPEGGFFLAITLPFKITKSDLRDCAKNFKVIFCLMSFFHLERGGENQIRIAFSNLQEHAIDSTIHRLAEYLEQKSTH